MSGVQFVPIWQRERWPQLNDDASSVPFGLQPRKGVDYGCGQPDCRDCYEADADIKATLLLAPRSFDDAPAIEPEFDLANGAAHLSAQELVENWKSALLDGMSLADLLGDVDEVIHHLQQWKAGLISLGEPLVVE